MILLNCVEDCVLVCVYVRVRACVCVCECVRINNAVIILMLLISVSFMVSTKFHYTKYLYDNIYCRLCMCVFIHARAYVCARVRMDAYVRGHKLTRDVYFF